jgi:protein-disulfide isomerase
MAYPEVKEIQQRLGNQLRFVYRHFPRPEHPHARHAAEAAECAAAQGEEHFWSMHDALFEHQHALEDADLIRYAENIGLDMERFRRDLNNHTYLRRVQEDLKSAQLSGVHGTPTFFINGQRYEGIARGTSLYRELVSQAGGVAAVRGTVLQNVDDVSAESVPSSDAPGWIREQG